MDIKAKIDELAKKITGDKTLLKKFQDNPVSVVENLLGVDLPDEQIMKLVDGIKAKIKLDNVADAIGAFGNLFGKK